MLACYMGANLCLAAPITIQTPENGLGKLEEDGPNAQAPATYMQDLEAAPDFHLAQSWKLQPSGE